MRRLRNQTVIVPAFVLVIALLVGAVIANDIIIQDSCQAWICPSVASGDLPAWVAEWIYGCTCKTDPIEGGDRALAKHVGPTCQANQAKPAPARVAGVK